MGDEAKALLLKLTADAFDGRPDMSLMASLKGITPAEAAWRPSADSATAEQLVRHVAWAKARFCFEGFGKPMPVIDDHVNADGDCAELPWDFPCGAGWACATHPGIAGAVALLEQSHRVLLECLHGCTEDASSRPIPTRHGRQSAAHFFSVMLMHDLYHAGQIRTRRTAAGRS